MRVADAIADWLAEKEIVTAFGIIGGGNFVLFDAIQKKGATAICCCHHEQAAAMASTFFNRVRGRLASAVLVTTGAGSTNAITGVMAAWMDSIPLLVISGNEASKFSGSGLRVQGTQGYDSAGLLLKHTKYENRVMQPDLAVPCLNAAYESALHGRHGPSWVDVPKDIASAMV